MSREKLDVIDLIIQSQKDMLEDIAYAIDRLDMISKRLENLMRQTLDKNPNLREYYEPIE